MGSGSGKRGLLGPLGSNSMTSSQWKINASQSSTQQAEDGSTSSRSRSEDGGQGEVLEPFIPMKTNPHGTKRPAYYDKPMPPLPPMDSEERI